MNRTELAKTIYTSSFIEGDFVGRSGQILKGYFDKYQFESNPILLKAIAKHLSPLIPKSTEVLAGLEMGGIPVAMALSFEMGLPVAFVRKEAKKHGTGKLAEGADIFNRNACLIEDVITTGGQVIVSAEELREMGAGISNAAAVVLRYDAAKTTLSKKGLHLVVLFTEEELRNAA